MNVSLDYSVSISDSFERNFNSVLSYNFAFSIRAFALRQLRSLLNRLFRNLISHINDVILILNGAIPIVKEYDQIKAQAELKIISKFLSRFIELDASMAKSNYMESEELRQKMNICISRLYDIDFLLRKKAFQNSPLVKSNSDFISALALKSKTAIESTLAN